VDVALNVRSKADNSAQESKFLLNGSGLFIGRGPECAVLLDGHGISRQHLGMDGEDAALFITDLSSNGTWLNGKRLAQNRRSKVQDSDLIELPGYEIRIRTARASVAATQGAAPLPPKNDLHAKPPAGSIFGPLTLLEKFVVLLAVCSAALFAVYVCF
jgi:pSer/pThr/pTyr-binding forkhead associated (FHA) protein